MAAAPKKSGTLHKKLGPLTTIGWLGVTGGGLALYLLYRWYENNQAAAALAAQTAAADTSTLPLNEGGSTGTTSATTTSQAGTFSNLQQWLAALVSTGASGESSGALYNAGLAWSNGNCVTQEGYNALQSILPSLGAPPGVVAPLSVCAASKPAAKAATKIGSGYGTQSAGYTWVSPTIAAWLQKHGFGLWYQPTLGSYQTTKGAKVQGGTPLFASATEIDAYQAAQKAAPAPK